MLTGHPNSVYGPYGAPWLIGSTTGAIATPVPANLLDGCGQTGDTRFAVDSYAAFAEVNWRILPRLTVTGGLRYTQEDKQGDYNTTVFGGLATTSTALNNAKLSVLRPQELCGPRPRRQPLRTGQSGMEAGGWVAALRQLLTGLQIRRD